MMYVIQRRNGFMLRAGHGYYKLRLMHEIVFFFFGVPISEICLWHCVRLKLIWTEVCYRTNKNCLLKSSVAGLVTRPGWVEGPDPRISGLEPGFCLPNEAFYHFQSRERINPAKYIFSSSRARSPGATRRVPRGAQRRAGLGWHTQMWRVPRPPMPTHFVLP